MEINHRYEFHLVGDNSREVRLELKPMNRSYQVNRTDYVRDHQGKVMWSDFPQQTPLIVPRSEMERIEKMRRLSVRESGYDPLPDMVEQAELEQLEAQLVNPYRLLRQMLKVDRTA